MKSEFDRLKKKIILQVLWIVGISLVIGILIRYVLIDGVLQDPFANWFIAICEKVLGLDWYGAQRVYTQLFRNQKTLLLTGGLLLILIVVFYYSLSRIIRYFKEVIDGIDELADETADKIVLSPEMEEMEQKLNSVKNTLQKRARDVQEAEQKKNDLVMYLAHDIRTPLTSVIGYLNLLEETQLPPEQQKKYLDTTLENALRLETLINEFFDITRFSLQAIQLKKEEINLTHMIYQLADEFYPMFNKKNVEIVVNAEEEIRISADADKLARVFRNILKNAAAYSDYNTKVVIGVDSLEDAVGITFSNQGIVISAQQLETVFEKFYRADSSRSAQTGGAGLGLAIAKEIVDAHDGSIYAKSNEGRTTFTVILPKPGE